MSGAKRYSRAFALTAMDLLQFGTIQAVASYLQVGWDMIKEIHKTRLQARYRAPHLKDLVYLSIDEFSIRKGHTYMTIFVDQRKGRILHAVAGRSMADIVPFMQKVARQASRLKAVAIDMSHSYRKALEEHLPSVAIVYDRYHISALINRGIDDLRRQEHHHAEGERKQVMQGSRFLLLRNYDALDPDSQNRLQSLLEVNQPLLAMYTMKEQLRTFWTLPDRKEAASFLYTWCYDALDSGVKQLMKIGLTLNRHRKGLLNYFSHRITNAVAEGLNNKIKTLKRQAYGFRDMEYFKVRLYHLHTQRYALSG
jgi:transposase